MTALPGGHGARELLLQVEHHSPGALERHLASIQRSTCRIASRIVFDGDFEFGSRRCSTRLIEELAETDLVVLKSTTSWRHCVGSLDDGWWHNGNTACVGVADLPVIEIEQLGRHGN